MMFSVVICLDSSMWSRVLMWFDILSCVFSFFFFSSRRRHTRCALVTGVQTCALPIYRAARLDRRDVDDRAVDHLDRFAHQYGVAVPAHAAGAYPEIDRSEERRVGKECVSTCRSRWSPYQ